MTFVYTLLILILLFIIYFIYLQKKSKPADIDLSKAIETLITVADQKLGQEKQIIQTDLSNKKTAIEDLITRTLNEINKNNQKLEEVEKCRISSFSTLVQKLEDQKILTQQLKTTTEGLKNVLSNNQMRGAFGEQIAEDLLKMSGFVEGVNYDKQVSGDTCRPDFTVYMPDGIKINVDAKFPYQNLVKMSETEDKTQKEQIKKQFEQDIKNKIKEVSSREYINPENNTVDFVILFIPNEMIFSYIYDRFPEIWQDAMGKKVILAGPFSFTAIIRMVHQAYDNFHYQKNVANIIGYIKKFAEEFESYNKGFKEIGAKIESLNKQYLAVDTTRTNQLVKIVNKIKIDENTSSSNFKTIKD